HSNQAREERRNLGSEERVEINETSFEEEEMVSRVAENAKEDSLDFPKYTALVEGMEQDGQLDARKKDQECNKAWLGGVLIQIRTLSNLAAEDIEVESGATKKLREENHDTWEVDRQQERQQEGLEQAQRECLENNYLP
ncbi:hypothetical protein U1Q18_052124, partial [Sarracenia purpurea var. burkii]